MTSTSKWWKDSTVIVGIVGALSTIIAAIIGPNLGNYITQITSPSELKYVIYKAGWRPDEIEARGITVNGKPIKSVSVYVVHFINDRNKDLENIDMCYNLQEGGEIISTIHKSLNQHYLKENLTPTNKRGCSISWNYEIIRGNTSLNQYFLIGNESNVDKISIDISSNKVQLINNTTSTKE